MNFSRTHANSTLAAGPVSTGGGSVLPSPSMVLTENAVTASLSSLTVAVSCVPMEQLVSEGLRAGDRQQSRSWGGSDHTADPHSGLAQSLFGTQLAPPGLPPMASSDTLPGPFAAGANVNNRSFDDIHMLRSKLMGSSGGARENNPSSHPVANYLDVVMGSANVDVVVPDDQDAYRVHLLQLIEPAASGHNESESFSTLSIEPKPQQVAQVTVHWTQFQQLLRFVMSVAPRFKPPATPSGLDFPVDAAVSFVQNTSFLRRPELRSDSKGMLSLVDSTSGMAGGSAQSLVDQLFGSSASTFNADGSGGGGGGGGADSHTRELRRAYMESYLNAAAQNNSTCCLKEVQSFVGYRLYLQNRRDLVLYHTAAARPPPQEVPPLLPSGRTRRTIQDTHKSGVQPATSTSVASRGSSFSGGSSLHSARGHHASGQSSSSASSASSASAVSSHDGTLLSEGGGSSTHGRTRDRRAGAEMSQSRRQKPPAHNTAGHQRSSGEGRHRVRVPVDGEVPASHRGHHNDASSVPSLLIRQQPEASRGGGHSPHRQHKSSHDTHSLHLAPTQDGEMIESPVSSAASPSYASHASQHNKRSAQAEAVAGEGASPRHDDGRRRVHNSHHRSEVRRTRRHHVPHAAPPPKLTESDRAMLEECFRMIDVHDSGSIELGDTTTFLACATPSSFAALMRLLYQRADMEAPVAVFPDLTDGDADEEGEAAEGIEVPKWMKDITRIDVLPTVHLHPSTFIAMVEQLLIADAARQERVSRAGNVPSGSSQTSVVASSLGSTSTGHAGHAASHSQRRSRHHVHHRSSLTHGLEADADPTRTEATQRDLGATTSTTVAMLSEDNVDMLRRASDTAHDDLDAELRHPVAEAAAKPDADADDDGSDVDEDALEYIESPVVLSEWVDSFWMLHYHSLYLALATFVNGAAGAPLRDAIDSLHTQTLRALVEARTRISEQAAKGNNTSAVLPIGPEAFALAGDSHNIHASPSAINLTRTTSTTLSSDDALSSVSHQPSPTPHEALRHPGLFRAPGVGADGGASSEVLHVVLAAIDAVSEVLTAYPILFGYRTFELMALAYLLSESGLRTISAEEVLEWLVVRRATANAAFGVEELSSLLDTLSRAVPFSAVLRCLTPPWTGAGNTTATSVPEPNTTARTPRRCESSLLRLISRSAPGVDPEVCTALSVLVEQRGQQLRGGHCGWCDRVLALLQEEENQVMALKATIIDAWQQRDALQVESTQRADDLAAALRELGSVKALLQDAELRRVELLELLETMTASATADTTEVLGGTKENNADHQFQADPSAPAGQVADGVSEKIASPHSSQVSSPTLATPVVPTLDAPAGALRLTPVCTSTPSTSARAAVISADDRVLRPGPLLYCVPSAAFIWSDAQQRTVSVHAHRPSRLQFDFFVCYGGPDESDVVYRRTKERLSLRDARGHRCLELIVEDRKLRLVGSTPSTMDARGTDISTARMESSGRGVTGLGASTHSISTNLSSHHRRPPIRIDAVGSSGEPHTTANHTITSGYAQDAERLGDLTEGGLHYGSPDSRLRANVGEEGQFVEHRRRHHNLLYPYRSFPSRLGVSQLDRLKPACGPQTRHGSHSGGGRTVKNGDGAVDDKSEDDDDNDSTGSSSDSDDSLLGDNAVQRAESTMKLRYHSWHRVTIDMNWERQEFTVSLDIRIDPNMTQHAPKATSDTPSISASHTLSFVEPQARMEKTQRTKLLMADAGLVSGVEIVDVYPRRTMQLAYCNFMLFYE